jgi:serine/threonine protein phosphatase PrpC
MPFQIGPQHAQFLEETQHVTLDVQVDDIILMATDGVWDNFARAAVSRSIIEKIKAKVKYPNNLVKLADIAFDIVKRSFEVHSFVFEKEINRQLTTHNSQ